MTTSALALRGQIVTELIRRLKARPELANVTVSPFWPGDEAGNQTLWIDEVAGELTIPTMKDGTLDIDDEFTIAFEVSVLTVGVAEAVERANEIAGEVESVVREDPYLGVTAATFVATPQSARSTGTEVKGGGAKAFAEVVVSCATYVRSDT